MTPPNVNILWFRRDLRLRDHPALIKASTADRVIPLFIVDPALFDGAGTTRQARLIASLSALNEQMGGNLVLRRGNPSEVLAAVIAESGAREVHITADCAPAGRRRDQQVAAHLQPLGAELLASGTPYAVGPGTILNGSGSPYRVYTPFKKAWLAHGAPPPAGTADVTWQSLRSDDWPEAPEPPACAAVPAAGELAALQAWEKFLHEQLACYGDERDRPDRLGTSGLSAALKFGEVHPRTLLADVAALGEAVDGSRFVAQLGWRDFYADVLWHTPRSAWHNWNSAFDVMNTDTDEAGFEAWKAGRTGFPIVDAAMRQLAAEGWLPNRVRMLVASFLVKDLHLPWQWGAKWFMQHLLDGDVANNQHGWQWVAGTGTDAAPYFRIFNPITQGLRFDPNGDYVRAHVPELRHIDGAAIHTPWEVLDGYLHDYPERIVDHAAEREESLRRYSEIKKYSETQHPLDG